MLALRQLIKLFSMVNSVQFHNTGRAFDSVSWKTVDEANNFLSDYFTTGYHPVRALNKKTRNRDFHIRDLEESAR